MYISLDKPFFDKKMSIFEEYGALRMHVSLLIWTMKTDLFVQMHRLIRSLLNVTAHVRRYIRRPSQPNGVMLSTVNYLTTHLLGRLSPLSS